MKQETSNAVWSRWLNGFAVGAAMMIGVLGLRKLERIVVQVERAADALAPLGAAGVDLGIQAIEQADPEAVKDAAAEVGREGIDRLKREFSKDQK